MHALLNIAVRAARQAGNVILRNVNRLSSIQVDNKGWNELVTEVDRAAEQEIIQTIHRSYPDHGILAEESGEQGDNEYQWIIDPLDGTTNFIHGFPVFCVSIALRVGGRLEHGVIYDPMREELFTASRGQGAQLDGRKIRVSARKTLQGALIGTGFPYRANTRWLDQYLLMLKAVTESVAGVRRPGSAALDLAYVAAGRYDAFWELGLSAWDLAAGALIIREAGGLVTDINGSENYLESGNIVAGNPKVFGALMRTIAPHVPKELL